MTNNPKRKSARYERGDKTTRVEDRGVEEISPPGVYYREELDTGMCSVPDCDHTAHDGLYLHQACHTFKGLQVSKKDRILHMRCAECQKHVSSVAVGELMMLDHDSPTCQHSEAFYAYYKSGWLILQCSACEQDLYKLPVLSRLNPYL
jgi:hypothetical protein